ncbi:hypothetical protein FLAN108750_03200 [Flavobacterium antarcticum]|uniref:hypothetical protein n=1 Tax=Flavobacterium antarcticum TaxID=271155 RepID=UPI0003B43323|nr:hypothetical protein [Flavobacterium antarcticum]
MAEIKIEKKAPIWPWIVGLLILALAVYFLFFKDTAVVTDGTTATNDTIVDQTEMQNNRDDTNLMGVAAFVAFVKNDDGNMTLDHEYSNEALNKLISATEEVSAKTDFDSKMDLDKAREHADAITKNPEATDHADHIKMATDMISTVLQNLQKAKFPNLQAEADKAKMASQAINVKELALNQKEKIKAFFDDAADLLDKMNR